MSSVEASTPIRLIPLSNPSLGSDSDTSSDSDSSNSSPELTARWFEQHLSHFLPNGLLKPSALITSPLTRNPTDPSVLLLEEENKLRQMQHLHRTSIRCAVAQDTYTRRSIREMRILDLARRLGRPTPNMVLAVASAVEQTVIAESELLDTQIEEAIERLHVLRLTAEDTRASVAAASRQVGVVRAILHESGIQEADLEPIELPPTPPQTPPPSVFEAVDFASNQAYDNSEVFFSDA